jgi:anti-anti-sigma regulatory factor
MACSQEEHHYIRFEGRLTVTNSVNLHAKLFEALRDFKSIVVDSSNASEIDVTFIQLLLAARNTAGARGKTFEMPASANAPLADALSRCGFEAASILTPAASDACNKGNHSNEISADGR